MSKYSRTSETGLVSILTVLFFMIFISILVVGFIKIMSDEQRQSTDNDLSASAYAAALSGVEDAKRIIAHCADKGPGGARSAPQNAGPACDAILSSDGAANQCAIFKNNNFGMNGLRSQLGIKQINNGDDIVVSTQNDTQYLQYYTCLTIAEKTTEVELPVTEGVSKIFNLDTGSSAFDNIDITWRPVNAADVYAAKPISLLLPQSSAWSNGTSKYPPMLRIQLIPYTAGALDLDASERGSRTIFVSPSVTAGNRTIAVDNRNIAQQGRVRSPGAIPLVNASSCTTGLGYTCRVTVSGLSGNASAKYYARVSIVYGGGKSHFVAISPKNGGSAVLLDGVQPRVDVTGRTNNVFRRVKAKVSTSSSGLVPDYPLESAASICKDMTVGVVFSYNCP